MCSQIKISKAMWNKLDYDHHAEAKYMDGKSHVNSVKAWLQTTAVFMSSKNLPTCNPTKTNFTKKACLR